MSDVFVSIGIIAHNEEGSISKLIESIFSQTLLGWLRIKNLKCEIVCLANGCNDATASVAARTLTRSIGENDLESIVDFRVVEIEVKGKTNSLNEFYHNYSSEKSKYLFLSDADIVIDNENTLLEMMASLEMNEEAFVSVDRPIKDIQRKAKKTVFDRISLAASGVTASASGQLSGQLYCIRSEIAKKVYFPRTLIMDDGFLKFILCTNFMRESINPGRIAMASNASHTFEAYTSISDIFRNQKRQIIGQTMVHLLCDKILPKITMTGDLGLSSVLRKLDADDPSWFSSALKNHAISIRSPRDLYPGVVFGRFGRLRGLSILKKIRKLPYLFLHSFVLYFAARSARNEIVAGNYDYWPDTKNKRI